MLRACSQGMISCGLGLPRASLYSGRRCTTTLASGGRVPSLRYFRAHSFLSRFYCSFMGSAYGLRASVRSITKRWRASESEGLGFQCGLSFFFFFFCDSTNVRIWVLSPMQHLDVITVPSVKLTCTHCLLEQYDEFTTMHNYISSYKITYLYLR